MVLYNKKNSQSLHTQGVFCLHTKRFSSLFQTLLSVLELHQINHLYGSRTFTAGNEFHISLKNPLFFSYYISFLDLFASIYIKTNRIPKYKSATIPPEIKITVAVFFTFRETMASIIRLPTPAKTSKIQRKNK